MYRIRQTKQAEADLDNLVAYMIFSLRNGQAANNFLNLYQRQVQNLKTFPFAYRGINFEYQGYEIRMKTFSSYNIFFVIDLMRHQIIILRVLKDRQNWKAILQEEDEYSF